MRIEWTTVPVLAIIFVATLIRSAFGFGEALVAVPLLALLMPIEVAGRPTGGRGSRRKSSATPKNSLWRSMRWQTMSVCCSLAQQGREKQCSLWRQRGGHPMPGKRSYSCALTGFSGGGCPNIQLLSGAR
jgi:hypothetical protein